MRGRPRQRVARDVMRVAVRIGAVPQHLDERQGERALELLRIRRIEEGGVGGEVAAAREQERVVHCRHAQRAARDVLRDRHHRAAEDAALAVAVEEHVARVEHGVAARILERRVRDEARWMDEQSGEEQLIQHRLLQPIGEAREQRQVPENRDGVPDVLVRHADPFGGAEDEVVLVGHVLDVTGAHLGVGPEEPVPVDRRARRDGGPGPGRQRGARDVAHERRRLRRRLVRGDAVAVQHELRGRRRAVDVALHVVRADHAAEDARIDAVRRRVARARAAADAVGVGGTRAERRHARGARMLQNVRHGERRRVRAEAREPVVADEEHALREAPAARHREVPGEIEVVAGHAGRRERREDGLHVRAARFLHRVARRDVVAVGEEVGVGCEDRAARVLHVAERHDVGRPLVEVDRGMDDHRALGLGGGIGVELDEHQVVNEGRRVHQHHRRGRVEGAGDVRDGRRARHGEVDPGDAREDGDAGAEAVVPVVVARIHEHARVVLRHRDRGEIDPLPAVRGAVGDREEVARERIQAHRRIEEVARAVAGNTRRSLADHTARRGRRSCCRRGWSTSWSWLWLSSS